ncbi:hypothetical protein AVEN_168080-1 [Araneus ventricosus]|uniref:Uncharacterized protein n=1 Tax=Araneus ventricosus TaxID=182803 RepID=A0A4Y2SCZ1_ARAVE|nr:hypothetical protein AVEN_168080-1 [Araneus ventricosus]
MCYLLETRQKKCDWPETSLPENRMKDVAFFEIVSFDLAGPLYLKEESCLLIDTDICKIPGYPLLKCQKVVADRFSEEVDGFRRSKASLCNPGNY